MAAATRPVLARASFLQLVMTLSGEARFTQDTPIMPDVWAAYACERTDDDRQDLIITAHNKSSSFAVAKALELALVKRETLELARLAALRSDAAARLTFEELILDVLPLTLWWQRRFWGRDQKNMPGKKVMKVESLREMLEKYESKLAKASPKQAREKLDVMLRDEKDRDKWFVLLLIFIVAKSREDISKQGLANLEELIGKINAREATVGDCQLLWSANVREFIGRLAQVEPPSAMGKDEEPLVFAINRNREFSLTTYQSRQTVKADAAERVFRQDSSNIVWAIIDSGIDATHPAFADRAQYGADHRFAPGEKVEIGKRRVIKTYDFRQIRDLISLSASDSKLTAKLERTAATRNHLATLRQDLIIGRQIDWNVLAPLLEISSDAAPPHPHGTHVAGILGGDLKDGESDSSELSGDLQGVCPDIRLYDLRVCDESGGGEEFVIIAALQFLSHLNRNKDLQVVHGVNLSLSIRHEVANYACGHTPVCVQANQLASDGVVVVAAAGNLGYQKFATEKGLFESYSAMNITDPGNADLVITVGATHKDKPHTYGVSYFSSRGPTGDGRMKPDLLAPGERIYAPVPGGGVGAMDGTSMAAPHVSGAAAMLIARHKEMRRNPQRIKQVLCATATDLGRERSFQGAGLVDILRALQSV